jgi:hypothetical protein
MQHILLRVGKYSDGKPAFELVHAVPCGGSNYVVEFTPRLAYGIAAGDAIDLGADGRYSVTSRAGNVAVRVYSREPSVSCENDLTFEVEKLGGRLDGSANAGLAYTIPVEAGFAAIEKTFETFVSSHPDCVWEYGNVYAEDGSALDWWNGKL